VTWTSPACHDRPSPLSDSAEPSTHYWSEDKKALVPGEIRQGMSAVEVRFYCLEIPMVL
jgi:hypothetical protein